MINLKKSLLMKKIFIEYELVDIGLFTLDITVY